MATEIAPIARCWSARDNTDIQRQRLLQGGASLDLTASSGDFTRDYAKACEMINVVRHPRISHRKLDEMGKSQAIQVFGFSLDLGTATALSMCLPINSSLTSLHFWNAGLTAEVIKLLAVALRRSSIIRLHLDWNPIADLAETKAFADLVGPTSPLQMISLRGNRLTDDTIRPVFDAIAEGGPLLVFNASNNSLTKASCAVVSSILRFDRTLLSVNLSHNPLGDGGVVSLFGAMRAFPLDPTEVKLAKKFLPRGKLPSGQVSCTGNNTLRNLVLTATLCTDEAVQAATAMVGENTTLSRISLMNNRISQALLEQVQGHARLCVDKPLRTLIEESAAASDNHAPVESVPL